MQKNLMSDLNDIDNNLKQKKDGIEFSDLILFPLLLRYENIIVPLFSNMTIDISN